MATVGLAFVLLLVSASSGQARPLLRPAANTPPAQLASVKDANGVERAKLDINVCPQSCAGMHVYIDSASNHFGNPGQRYENCTIWNTRTALDFSPAYNGEQRTIQMEINNSGTCALQASYNVWIVEAYKDGKQISRGSVWLGEDAAGPAFPYHAECNRNAPYTPMNWECKKTAQFSLSVGTPGWKPTYPECPETYATSGQYCRIQVHLDAVPRLTLPVPCLPYRFTGPIGVCLGTSDGSSKAWTVPFLKWDAGILAAFGWIDYGGHKQSAYVVSPRLGVIAGVVPSASSPEFRVTFAWTIDRVDRYFVADGARAPGTPGGPLYIDFRSGTTTGADVYIEGYLQEKPIRGLPPKKSDIAQLVKRLRTLEGQPPQTVQADLRALFKKFHP